MLICLKGGKCFGKICGILWEWGKVEREKKHSRASVNSMALNSQGSTAAQDSACILTELLEHPLVVISKQRLSDCYINKNEIIRNFSITRIVFGEHSNRQFPLV